MGWDYQAGDDGRPVRRLVSAADELLNSLPREFVCVVMSFAAVCRVDSRPSRGRSTFRQRTSQMATSSGHTTEQQRR